MRDSHVEEFIASHRSELFSELKEEIADDRITDIEWDGYNLWITHLDNGSYLSKKKLTAAFVDNFSNCNTFLSASGLMPDRNS